MTEINQNYGNYGHPIEKNNPVHLKKGLDVNPAEIKEENAEHKYTPDTGVLGRSQVKSSKGGNITKSVNEAVKLAQQNPSLMFIGDEIFDSAYNEFISQGMSEDKAYFAAMAVTDKLCS